MFQDVIKILNSIPDTCNSASRAQEQKLGSHTIIQIALNAQVVLKCVRWSYGNVVIPYFYYLALKFISLCFGNGTTRLCPKET